MIVKEMKKLSAAFASAGYLLSASVSHVMAQSPFAEVINIKNVQGDRGIKAGTPLDTLMQNAFTIVFAVAALTVLVFLIYGAFKWITSGGEKEGTKSARTYITNALVGLAVLALAFVILRVVGGIVGFDVLNSFNIPRLDASPRP